jgi:hypothetical protein
MIYIKSRSPDVAEKYSSDNMPDPFTVSYPDLKQEQTSIVSGASFKSKSLHNLDVHDSHASNPQSNGLKSNKSVSDCSDLKFWLSQKCSEFKEFFEDPESLLQCQETTGHLNLKCKPDQPNLEFTLPRPTSALSDRNNSRSITTPNNSSNGSIMHLNDKPEVPQEDSREHSFSSHSVQESSQIMCENCN